MRTCIYHLWTYLACCWITTSAWGNEPVQFPYVAVVQADDVYVRSGPGRQFYPTDKLPRNLEVEVWRHDPGGWLAIRPPQTSFSWISSRYLQLESARVASVTSDQAVSRLGTNFSDRRDVSHVRLHPSESVELLDPDHPYEADQQLWYKIAPPAGEFRWISSHYVVRKDLLTSGLPEQKAEPQPGLSASGTFSPPETMQQATAASFEQAGQQAEARAYEPPASYEQSHLNSEVPVEEQAGSLARATSDALAAYNQATGQVAGMSAEQDLFQQDLLSLELSLTKMVSEEPTVWSFGELNRRAELLLSSAQTAQQRGQVRLLTNKIARFDAIQKRYDSISQATSQLESRNGSQGDVVRVPTSAGVPRNLSDFEVVGKLAPVVSRRPGAPTYAIVGAQNEVQCFVTPGPGVNLQPFLGQSIGLTGQRGFIPELNKPHIMASQVTPIRR